MRRRELRCAISLAWLLLQTASLRPPRREVCRGLIAGSSLVSLPSAALAVPRYTDRVARSGGPGAATLETVEGPGTDGRAYGLLRLPDGARCLLASAAPSLTFDGDRGNVLAGQVRRERPRETRYLSGRTTSRPHLPPPSPHAHTRFFHLCFSIRIGLSSTSSSFLKVAFYRLSSALSSALSPALSPALQPSPRPPSLPASPPLLLHSRACLRLRPHLPPLSSSISSSAASSLSASPPLLLQSAFACLRLRRSKSR